MRASLSRLAPLAVFGAIAVTASTARADDAPTFADHAGVALDDVERRLGFLVSPASMAAGLFGAEVDMTLVRRVAFGVEGGVAGLAGAPSTNIAIGFLVYPTGDTFRGLVLSPRVVYGRAMNEPVTRWGQRGEVVAVGGVAGWQWAWDYGLTVRIGAGVAKVIGSDDRGLGAALAMGSHELVLVTDASAGWLF